ncbi:ATP-dependent DNA helicase 2 subunit KU80 [Vitis vinifera]|uniref:ATP-dependent DNA helicase 2 subunit KU80 n=1 Tax=Vitis vinifera TaxID=29760 RepID=A0A438IWC7_VITVI|nr:ATP-dependent DNA helicase 2 subunit KU80 [Vitis vinifera]
MIRNQEALVLLLDVSPPMHNFLPEVEKLCFMLLQKKAFDIIKVSHRKLHRLIYNKKDLVGIVLFGTKVTKNELTKKVGGYKHVLVSQDIKVVDGDLVEAVRELPRGTFAGDFLDAIVVGMDMLIKKFLLTKRGKIKKRLCLITSALCPTKGPYKGAKEDEIGTIAEQMTAHGMRLECIVARGRLSGNMNMRIMEENDLLLKLFSKKTIAKTVYVESPTSLLGALRTRNVAPVTIFRGDLELSPKMEIKVSLALVRANSSLFKELLQASNFSVPGSAFARPVEAADVGPPQAIRWLRQWLIVSLSGVVEPQWTDWRWGFYYLPLIITELIQSSLSILFKPGSSISCSAYSYVTLGINVPERKEDKGTLMWVTEGNRWVWVYKKSAEELPVLKLYSDEAPPTDKFATHEVRVNLQYKSVEDPSKVVPLTQRIQGYSYGPQVVPVSSAEWEAVKFEPEKGVKLLGFTDASNIMRNTKAILAVSALARAMKEMNKVAILRCVWRRKQRNVIIGILTPNVSEKDSVPDSFYFNVLPYAEDVQEFQFPSFSNLPLSWQPNEEQQEAADNLVQMLYLAPFGREESLLPDVTPNPVLERFYRYLELKSKKPYAAVPPVDKTLKTITEPDPKLLAQNKSIIDEFKRRFELKQNPKPKKSTRDRQSGVKEEANIGESSDAGAINSVENTSVITMVKKIGDSTPIQDFEAMMSHRESPEWVGKAIKEMKNKIFDLVQNSNERDNHLKALDCLVAFRKGCILEQKPTEFSNFLLHIYKFCKYHNLNSFCESLASKEIMLIPKTEQQLIFVSLPSSLSSEVTER